MLSWNSQLSLFPTKSTWCRTICAHCLLEIRAYQGQTMTCLKRSYSFLTTVFSTQLTEESLKQGVNNPAGKRTLTRNGKGCQTLPTTNMTVRNVETWMANMLVQKKLSEMAMAIFWVQVKAEISVALHFFFLNETHCH